MTQMAAEEIMTDGGRRKGGGGYEKPAMEPGLRKAAIVLSMIDAEDAIAVCRRVDPVTAHDLINALSSLGGVGVDEKRRALGRSMERIQIGGGSPTRLATQLREAVLGLQGSVGDGADESFEQLALLDKADPHLIWRAMSDEMPQAIALIARHLSPGNVAKIMAAMPEETRGEVAFRIASPRPPTAGALKAFARATDRLVKIATSGGGGSQDGYVTFLADVVSQLSRKAAQSVISDLKSRSEELGNTIEQMVYSFSDLLALPAPDLQTILRNTPSSELALAMKGITDDLRQIVFKNLSKRARMVLEEEIELLGPIPASEAERAQTEILQVARTLDAAGEISLEPAEVEYVD